MGTEQMTRRQTVEQADFGTPDEVRAFERGRAEILSIGGTEIGRLVLEPGWRWSDHVKPLAGTELCEAPHFQYLISGRVGVRMADGSEHEIAAGEVSVLEPGHDAGVVGDEPVGRHRLGRCARLGKARRPLVPSVTLHDADSPDGRGAAGCPPVVSAGRLDD
jgi:hypothetical protein